jgi:hypothetical protein
MSFVVRNVCAFLILIAAILILSIGMAHAGGGGGGEGEAVVQYVELDPLMLPIVDETGVSQVINLVVALEVANVAGADKVKALKPKLTDAFITDMYGALNRHAALKGGVLQIGYIKERLYQLSKDIVGLDEEEHDLVNSVLIQVVQQRQI